MADADADKDVEKMTNKNELIEDDEHPVAKSESIFKRLFKRVKETKEFKSMEESITKIKDIAATDDLPADSVTVEAEKPLERVDGELTFEQIQEIRKLEAEEKAIQDTETALSKEEAKKASDELKKQQAKEREQQRKEKEKAQQERVKQQKKISQQKEKERKAAQREKEKERKATQKVKDQERKAAQNAKTKATTKATSNNKTSKK
jgi:hypothetical protein